MSRAAPRLCLIALASSLALAGCMYYAFPTAGRLYLSGKYGELERYVEAKMHNGGAVDPEELSYLCGAYWKLQKYDKLMPCADQMERNLERIHTVSAEGSVLKWDNLYSFLWGRAFAYLELGAYDQAMKEAEHAYQFGLDHRLDPYHHTYSLSALALAHALRGDRPQALRYAQLLDQVDTSDYKYQGLAAEKTVNLAKVYVALGDYDHALAAMTRPAATSVGYEVASNLFFGKPLTGFAAYQELPRTFMLAKSLLETGKREEAKRGYDEILKDREAEHNRDIYWLVLFDRGRIAEQEGDLQLAIGFYARAVEVIEEQRATFKTEATKIGYVGDKQTVYERLVVTLIADKQEGRAFEYVERSKSRALVDLLASKREFAIPPADEPALRAVLRHLDAGRDSAPPGERAGHARRRRRSREEGVAQLQADAPELASLVTVTRVSVPDLQGRLARDETLVEYYFSRDQLYAFVLTPRGLRTVQLSSTDLPRRIQEFRSAVEDPGSARYQELAEPLYAQLVQPLIALIDTQKLTIVPHGMLHYLPFGALHDGSNYLIDRYSLRYLPSASVIEYLTAPPSRPAQGAIVIGNPDLPDQPPLAYAEQEAAAVASAIADSTVLLGTHATETAFKRLGGRFRYLHLATHGRFASENPLRSGLWLTKDADNDGLLSVEELYSLHLDADLVTLSACDTGLSKLSNGDDLVGLARGFLYAGSRAIVASLWSVDDEATASLMSAFYANLATTGAREALRQAQRQTRTRYPHPFYWAAFELTGQG